MLVFLLLLLVPFTSSSPPTPRSAFRLLTELNDTYALYKNALVDGWGPFTSGSISASDPVLVGPPYYYWFVVASIDTPGKVFGLRVPLCDFGHPTLDIYDVSCDGLDITEHTTQELEAEVAKNAPITKVVTTEYEGTCNASLSFTLINKNCENTSTSAYSVDDFVPSQNVRDISSSCYAQGYLPVYFFACAILDHAGGEIESVIDEYGVDSNEYDSKVIKYTMPGLDVSATGINWLFYGANIFEYFVRNETNPTDYDVLVGTRNMRTDTHTGPYYLSYTTGWDLGYSKGATLPGYRNESYIRVQDYFEGAFAACNETQIRTKQISCVDSVAINFRDYATIPPSTHTCPGTGLFTVPCVSEGGEEVSSSARSSSEKSIDASITSLCAIISACMVAVTVLFMLSAEKGGAHIQTQPRTKMTRRVYRLK